MGISVYDIIHKYDEAMYTITNADPEYDREAIEEAWEVFALTEEQLYDKADVYAKVIKNLSAESAAYKAEAKRLNDLAKSRENAVDRLKSLMSDAMKVMGKDKVETTIGKFALQKNPPSCKVYDETKIPEEYWIPVAPKLDGKGVIEHFKQTGEQLAGVDVVQEMGLRFR